MTNAAIKQTATAINNLNSSANAQRAAEAGVNVSSNLLRSNNNAKKAANGLRSAANKFDNFKLPQIAASLRNAAAAADTGAEQVKAAKLANSALKQVNTVLNKNMNKLKNGQMPTNGLGLK